MRGVTRAQGDARTASINQGCSSRLGGHSFLRFGNWIPLRIRIRSVEQTTQQGRVKGQGL